VNKNEVEPGQGGRDSIAASACNREDWPRARGKSRLRHPSDQRLSSELREELRLRPETGAESRREDQGRDGRVG
jgi:hypothetical protein